MLVKVVGIENSVSKKDGKTYSFLHCIVKDSNICVAGSPVLRLNVFPSVDVSNVKPDDDLELFTYYNKDFHSWNCIGIAK